MSGGLFEGPDFPLEIREPQAMRQKKKTSLEGRLGDEGGTLGVGISISAVESQSAWKGKSSCAVQGNESLPGGGQEASAGARCFPCH